MMLFIWYCQYLSIVASGLMPIKVVIGFSVWYICLMMPWKWESKCTVCSIYHVSKSLRVFITNINNPDKCKRLNELLWAYFQQLFSFCHTVLSFLPGQKHSSPVDWNKVLSKPTWLSYSPFVWVIFFFTVQLKYRSSFLSKSKKQNLSAMHEDTQLNTTNQCYFTIIEILSGASVGYDGCHTVAAWSVQCKVIYFYLQD